MTDTARETVHLNLGEVHNLAFNCLKANGCDDENAQAIADNMTAAERDGSVSHGLFRLPGYVSSLRSGKADGKARPRITRPAPGVVRADAVDGFAPLALEQARRQLVEAARMQGIALLALVRCHHFAALWPEVEALARQCLVAIAVTSTLPPEPSGLSISSARGEVMVAARDGHLVPPGVGLDAAGNPTTDPKAILDGGVMLPFGGYKGAAISLMVELLAGALLGDVFSFEAGQADNYDGGPSRGGELIIAIDPARTSSGAGWRAHGEALFREILASGGEGRAPRLPGDRRYANRAKTPAEGINLPQALYEKIVDLTGEADA